MVNGIESGIGLGQAFPLGEKGAAKAAPVEDFSKFLGEMVDKVNQNQQAADKAVQGLVTGEAKGLHEVMIAVEKSSISFQFLAQVRNKALEAYQEIMRMPV
jgi:flagellar hook-basal body complex protein FliE